jgi:hypothetical protein
MAVARLFDLWKANKQNEALDLQQALALAESPTKAGIASTKYAASIATAPRAGVKQASALLRPRRPYIEPSEDVKSQIRKTVNRWMRTEYQHKNADYRASRL